MRIDRVLARPLAGAFGPSLLRAIVSPGLVALLAASCASPPARAPAAAAPPAPLWQPAAHDGTDEGRLRAKWEAAVHETMAPYDAIVSGRNPAYEGSATIAGKSYGPMFGAVRDDEVDGARYRRLDLHGTNVGAVLTPATSRQRSAFFVYQAARASQRNITCDDCIDRGASTIDFEPTLRFSERKMTLVETGPGSAVVSGHIVAGVVLRQIDPSALDLETLKALWPPLAQGTDSGDELVLTDAHDGASLWIDIARPPTVDDAHPHCELVPPAPATIAIDKRHPSSWRVLLPGGPLRRSCCRDRPMHGPPTSGYYPNDCVEVRE